MGLFLVLFALILSGCSSKVLLPFEEEKLCNKGMERGVCGSLSDIYKDSINNPDRYNIPRR